MYEVQKRDGKIAEFDIAKISSAISKAFDALECAQNGRARSTSHSSGGGKQDRQWLDLGGNI